MSDVTDFSAGAAGDAAAQIRYLDGVAQLGAQAKEATFVMQGIEANARVLDCGCGVGDDVRAISARVGAGGEAVGVDANGALIAAAIARGVPANARFLIGSAEGLPFPEASFDAVRAERLLQHLADPQRATNEMHRVLRPGGSLLAIDQDWQSIVVAGGSRSTTRKIVDAFVDSLADGWAGRRHREHFVAAGFTQIESRPFVTSLSFVHAYAFVLESAVAAAIRGGALQQEEADAWVRGLLAADARGTFFYGVTVFLTIAMR
ncbi:MAG: methyltransferase domain-containing protein [Candidatus Eremiobacteraeota bacterium]|nr:methyltransferase domain-containing protein [Candidatus Eremiobacteraeota bacterium]